MLVMVFSYISEIWLSSPLSLAAVKPRIQCSVVYLLPSYGKFTVYNDYECVCAFATYNNNNMSICKVHNVSIRAESESELNLIKITYLYRIQIN